MHLQPSLDHFGFGVKSSKMKSGIRVLDMYILNRQPTSAIDDDDLLTEPEGPVIWLIKK